MTGSSTSSRRPMATCARRWLWGCRSPTPRRRSPSNGSRPSTDQRDRRHPRTAALELGREGAPRVADRLLTGALAERAGAVAVEHVVVEVGERTVLGVAG